MSGAARVEQARAQWPVGATIGSYKVERVLGAGGMGVVLGMRHEVLGRPVAIKVLHRHVAGEPEVAARFIEEAKSVNRIRHPNVVEIWDIARLPDGRDYLIMEWLEGESLAARMIRQRLSIGEAARILIAICNGLEAAHRSGVVHRDLKPENVFLGAGDVVKIIDFGIAKAQSADRAFTTESGVMVGTPAYMSPEQLKGSGVDHRTDLYALGCMAFELFTGRVPFTGDSGPEVMVKQLSEEPPVAREVRAGLSRELSELIRGLMAKDAGKRPTLEAARERFLKVAMDATDAALLLPPPQPGGVLPETWGRKPAPTERTPRTKGKKRMLFLGFVIGLVVAALTVALLSRS